LARDENQMILTLSATLFGVLCGHCNPVILAANERAYLVRKKDFACVLQNIDTYKKLERDPVYIYLTYCPNPNPDLVAESLKDIAGQVVVPPYKLDPREPESILVLSKRELDCLPSYKRLIDDAKDNELLEVPTELCEKS
jgi:hypothetical protein